MINFGVGNVVRHKLEGSPNMTVNYINAPTVHCRWFVGSELHSGEFNQLELILVAE